MVSPSPKVLAHYVVRWAILSVDGPAYDSLGLSKLKFGETFMHALCAGSYQICCAGNHGTIVSFELRFFSFSPVFQLSFLFDFAPGTLSQEEWVTFFVEVFTTKFLVRSINSTPRDVSFVIDFLTLRPRSGVPFGIKNEHDVVGPRSGLHFLNSLPVVSQLSTSIQSDSSGAAKQQTEGVSVGG